MFKKLNILDEKEKSLRKKSIDAKLPISEEYKKIIKQIIDELTYSQIEELAEKYDLPIVVHSRDSIQDVYDILKEHKCRGVIHCFSGSIEMAKEFIKLGFFLVFYFQIEN